MRIQIDLLIQIQPEAITLMPLTQFMEMWCSSE